MKYVYPAVIVKDENCNSPAYLVRFPDFGKEYVTQGETLEEAVLMAQDWLALMITAKEDKGLDITASSNLSYQKEQNEIFTLIAIDTDEYRQHYGTQSIKKTLTIPAWINTKAEAAGINFSQTLKEALREKLGL